MGRVTVVGGCRAKAPSTGILASTLPVGSTVKLMEGGTAVEYLVVNQGIPSNSSLYDASCDGTWLLRKGMALIARSWNQSGGVSTYASSDINTWLNEGFINDLGSSEQAAIKQVKIPYAVGGTNHSKVNSGADGLITRAFLLSGVEVGFGGTRYMLLEGAKLDYFNAKTGVDEKRIAYTANGADIWTLRSPHTSYDNRSWIVLTDGGSSNRSVTVSSFYRPALILPKTAVFAEDTMLLRGVV